MTFWLRPTAVAICCCGLVLAGTACGTGDEDREAVSGRTASGHEPPAPTSTTPFEPQLITATLEPRLARVGDRLAIAIENITDRPVVLTENYLPLRHLTSSGRKMVWAVPLESIYQPAVRLREDGSYGVNDIGIPGVEAFEPGATYRDEVTVPEVTPGRYQFVVPVCRGRPGDDCGPRLDGDDCFIHMCPAQTVELEFTVVE